MPLLTTQEVDNLESFDTRGARVLSAYLSLGPERQVQRTYRTVTRPW